MNGNTHPNVRPHDGDPTASLATVGSTGSGADEGSPAPSGSPEGGSDLLQNMVLDSSDVQTFLTTLARYAADQLSSDAHEIRCGITLLRPRKVGTVASSDDLARSMDEVQYRYSDGPCLDAARNGRTNHVWDMTGDDRWPDYLREIAGTGVRSILAVPIPLSGDARSALNLYSSSAETFTTEAIQDAEKFGRTTSATLRLAVRIARLTDAQENLTAAIRSRTTIDLAAGIIMAQNRCSQEEAMDILRTASSIRNVKLYAVAEAVVASVSDAAPTTHFEQ